MLDALTLDQMRMFKAVAEAGSFRLAATRLGRAQSAVSHSISNLEAELSVTLFDRSGHRPTLTAQGQVLLEDCKALLLRTDVLRARARGMQNDLELSLALMVDTLFPLSVISAALSRLHHEFPSVTIQLEVGTLGEPLDALLAGTADLAVTVGEDLRDARAEFHSLIPVRLVSVVARHHPLAENTGQRPTTSAELADHVQVVLVDPSERTIGRDFGIISQRKWKVGTQEAKHALIRTGVGWGRLPDWLIKEDIQQGVLVPLSAAALGNKGVTESYAYLSHRTDRPLLSAGRFLKKALQE
jgi:DNA-binding transcriptional LysR family regulator